MRFANLLQKGNMGKRNEANALRKKLAKKCPKSAKITINLEFVTKYFVLALHDI